VNINLTLVVQMIVFVVLIWFTMKVVWPMILGPMEERSRKIAAGLAAGDKGKQAKNTTTTESARQDQQAKQQNKQETTHAREALRREVATIAVTAASKVLE